MWLDQLGCGLFHFNFISVIGFWIGSELPKEHFFNSSINAREATRPRLIWSGWKFLLLWLSNSHQGQREKANLQGWAKLWEAVKSTMETNPFLKRLSKGLNAICRNAKLIPKTILESNLTWPNYCKILLVG